MIKITTMTLALVASSFLCYSSGTSHCDTITKSEPSHICTLIINADVTVVLVSDEQASLAITGDQKFTQLVSFKNLGDTLMIEAAGNTHLIGKGTIYVPASGLRSIQINSEANVRSYHSLRIPKLDVVVNGECNLAISNIGTVNIIETTNFIVEQSKEVLPLTPGLVKKKA